MGIIIKVDALLEELMKDFKKQAKEDGKERKKNEQVQWIMPPKHKSWQGDLYDWPSMYDAYESEELNDLMKFSIELSGESSNGNDGDVLLGQSQMEYKSMLERAFRARHTMTFPRNVAHTCARKKGQGKDEGPLEYGVIDYMRQLDKVAKRIV
jgi:hypothetical protein